MIIYSLDESNAVKGRKGVMSLMFLTQFFAYLLDKSGSIRDISKTRIQYTIQIIAAAYTLAGISKLTESGLSWASDAPFVALQVIKSFNYEYYNYGVESYSETGSIIASWIIRNAMFVKVLFTIALLLELFSFILILEKKISWFYAIMLLCMHVGIKLMMNIFFPTISYPLIIYCINPLYFSVLAVSGMYSQLRNLISKP